VKKTPGSRPRPGQGTALPGYRHPLVLLVALLVVLTIVAGSLSARYSGAVVLEPGVPSPRTFLAPRDVALPDAAMTAQAQARARAEIGPVLRKDPERTADALELLADAGLPPGPAAVIRAAYESPVGVSVGDLEVLRRRAMQAAETSLADLERQIVEVLVPTAIEDPAATEARRREAAAAVEPVVRLIGAGDPILNQGEPVKAEQIQLLASLGLYDPHRDLLAEGVQAGLGFLIAGLVSVVVAGYVTARTAPQLEQRQWLALALLLLTATAAQWAAGLANPAFIVMPLAAILVGSLLGETAALAWSPLLGLVAALVVSGVPFDTLMVATAAGGVAGWTAARLKTRQDLVKAGLAGGVAAGLALTALHLMQASVGIATLTGAGWAFAGALLGAVVAGGVLPLAETQAGFLTDFRLLELISPGQPLLQRLLVEAPGTYHHSLMMANLAEKACEAIGANALLARAGAMYHDVGKMKRPQFFIENQYGGENPHDELTPQLSTLIVTSHVKDGLEICAQYGIPPAIRAFVAEHHGTSTMTYFYKRALDLDPTVSETDFRYPGPRPRSPETAVMMMADSVESASRTLVKPTPQRVRALIERLIEQKLHSGQLDESPLTFRDLELITAAFEKILTSMLHRRVDYPTGYEVAAARARGGRTTVADRAPPGKEAGSQTDGQDQDPESGGESAGRPPGGETGVGRGARGEGPVRR
jgi:putative nucleotidyltransferase with HDIG domain